jgi:hypothetical protein
MLNARENFLETIKIDGSPDRLVNEFEALALIVPDPFLVASFPVGIEPGKGGFNDWGTEFLWPAGQPSFAPHHTADNLVVSNVENWKDELKIPIYDFTAEDWAPVKEMITGVDKNEKVLTGFLATGLFERLHSIMGFEGSLMGMLKYPDAYLELCEAIGKSRMHHLYQIVENIKPEMMFVHDDWGTKTNLFISPKHWRKFIKPHYEEMYGFLRSEGIIVMHHADSFLEPIIDDMVEIGINIWQGALPQNDIPKIQAQVAGKLTLQGGIDAPEIDNAASTEEEIREETRRACTAYGPGGHFIPSITYGGVDDVIFPHVDAVIQDEIRQYNLDTYGISG